MNLAICILSGLLWGLNDVFTRMLGLKVIQNLFLTVVIFSLILSFLQDSFSATAIIAYRSAKKELFSDIKNARSSFYLLFLAALFAGPLGMCTAIVGIDYAGPVYAGAITASYPIVTFLLAVFLIREKVTWKKSLGVVMAVTAIIAISIQGEQSSMTHLTLGLMFAAIAMIGWGIESVLLSIAYRKTQANISFLLGVRQTISAASYIIILMTLFFMHQHLLFTADQVTQQITLAALCILTASTSYLAYYYSIKVVGASLATLFNATFVFWDALFAKFFGLSMINHYYWIWAAMLAFGIYFADT